MAIVGLKMVTLALVDPKTQQIIKDDQGLSKTGIVEVGAEMLGTKTANISNMEGQATKISGNNAVQDVLIAPGSPTVALDFNNLDFEIKQKLLGFKSDTKGGYVMQSDKPHVAMLIETETLDRKKSIYFGFANGIMQENAQNIATDTDTAQTRTKKICCHSMDQFRFLLLQSIRTVLYQHFRHASQLPKSWRRGRYQQCLLDVQNAGRCS